MFVIRFSKVLLRTERSQQIFSKFCSGVYANFLWGDERSLKAPASDDISNSTEELLKQF